MGETRMKGRVWMVLAGVVCSFPAWAACNPTCPTCQAAIARFEQQAAVIKAASSPIIAPDYTCHDPNWASQYQPVGQWSAMITSTANSIDGGYVPPLFVAAEMYNESRGNANAIGNPVPNRALGLMQTLPPAEEQDAQTFGDVRGNNGPTPTAWPRIFKGRTTVPTAQESLTMGVQYQNYCARYAINALDPAALAACYNEGPGAGQAVAAAHNDYQTVLAAHPNAINYVSGFLAYAHCTPVSPTASSNYRKYP